VQVALADGLSAAVIAGGGASAALTLAARPPATPRHAALHPQRACTHPGRDRRAEVFCLIVGERPGLATAESLSAYVIFRPNRQSAEPDRSVISNIHDGGVPPARAARAIATLIDEILARGASGAALAAARAPAPVIPAPPSE
jgi:ethanolamine ammonia-lyase small subunit